MNVATTSPRQVAILHGLYGIQTVMLPIWVGIIAIVTLVRITIAYFNEFDTSVWAAASTSSNIFFGVIGIILTPMVMPMYVSQGVTRKNFALGCVILIAGVSLVAGTINLLGFGVEHIAYDIAGISESLQDTDVFGSPGRTAMVFVSFTLLYAAYLCSGWLIGSSYYSFGPVVGTLLIPFSLIPMLAAEFLLDFDWGWNMEDASGPVRIYSSIPTRLFGEVGIPYAAAALIALAVIAGGAWVASRFVQEATIE